MSGRPVDLPAVPFGSHTPIAPRLLRAEELADRWQVPTAAIYRLTREERIPAVRIGRYYRYALAAVEAFEAGGGVGADAESVR